MKFSSVGWSISVLVLGVILMITQGCKKEHKVNAPAPLARVVGNPFEGTRFFVPTYTNADQARRRLIDVNPEEATLIAKIADTPSARWIGDWSGEPKSAIGSVVRTASKKNSVVLFIAYNIPNRDCGQYSKGGAGSAAEYRAWIESFAQGIGSEHRAIVVLEPDALPHLAQCLSEADQKERLALIKWAVDTLAALPGVSVYLDAGHSRWVEANVMAERLKAAGISKARGFSLNTSNYIGDDELIEYGESLVALLGDTHFIIDSSRNGNGPAADNAWCNPPGRALGRKPTADTGNPHLDAFAWLKSPGESDGDCEGGPKAGQWFHERALELAKNAKW
jgi:endoglucanase